MLSSFVLRIIFRELAVFVPDSRECSRHSIRGGATSLSCFLWMLLDRKIVLHLDDAVGPCRLVYLQIVDLLIPRLLSLFHRLILSNARRPLLLVLPSSSVRNGKTEQLIQNLWSWTAFMHGEHMGAVATLKKRCRHHEKRCRVALT